MIGAYLAAITAGCFAGYLGLLADEREDFSTPFLGPIAFVMVTLSGILLAAGI